ncbi:MAG: hypothetical protein ACXWJB_07355 [Limisphaerales bacterium]
MLEKGSSFSNQYSHIALLRTESPHSVKTARAERHALPEPADEERPTSSGEPLPIDVELRAFNECSIIAVIYILQRRKDARYYGGANTWVISVEEAQRFSSMREAYDFCETRPDETMDVVVHLYHPAGEYQHWG